MLGILEPPRSSLREIARKVSITVWSLSALAGSKTKVPMEEAPAEEAPRCSCGRIACGAHARRSVSPPAKEEPAEEAQRERTRRGARHLRSSSLASKADGPHGGVSVRHACSSCIRSEAPLPQRLLRPRLLAEEPTRTRPERGLGTSSGPEPAAQTLLSGAIGKLDPSPSSSAQSPRSETNDWTLQFGRKLGRTNNGGGTAGTGFGSALCSASVGSYLWQ